MSHIRVYRNTQTSLEGKVELYLVFRHAISTRQHSDKLVTLILLLLLLFLLLKWSVFVYPFRVRFIVLPRLALCARVPP